MAEAVIRTERLVLEPFRSCHVSAEYVAWLNDKHLMRYSEQRHREHSLATCTVYADSFTGSPHYFWRILTDTAKPLHIGNINAYVDRINSVADIGILIGNPAAQGKGYGYEAWMGITRFLLNEQKLRKLTAGTMSVNKPMLRIMEKAGMIPDGVRKRQYLCEGEEVDIIHMALFNS